MQEAKWYYLKFDKTTLPNVSQIFRKVHDPIIIFLYDFDKSLADIVKEITTGDISVIATLIFLIRVMRHPVYYV